MRVVNKALEMSTGGRQIYPLRVRPMGLRNLVTSEKFTRADLSKIALECNYLFKTQQRVKLTI